MLLKLAISIDLQMQGIAGLINGLLEGLDAMK
jgi:hypothetical protein